MKLSQALREVARLHAEEPAAIHFINGICSALHHLPFPQAYEVIRELMRELGDTGTLVYAPRGDWTARPWMCLILAEYLEMDGR